MSASAVSDRKGVVGSREAGTLWGLFCERLRRTPDRIAYRDYDPVAKAWRDHTWRAVATRIDRFRAALTEGGLKPGDRVALLLPNGIDWVCFDMAAHALGLVVVALYPQDSPANNAFILGHSDARLALLDTQARWRSLAGFCIAFPGLTHVWIRNNNAREPAAVTAGPLLHDLADVLTAETPVPPLAPVAPTALATLIYTSGTTGQPKGVMLSHFALLWNAEAIAAIIPPLPDDVFLSILPLAHAFERTVGYYLPMMGGCILAYTRSAQDLRDDLVTVRPTVLLAVPYLFERIFAAIHANVKGNVVKRTFLHLAASLGWRRVEAAQNPDRHLNLGDRLLWPLLNRFVAMPVMAAFGGRLRVAVSGGAPLGADIARFLIGLGLPLVEGYGLTEAAPVVAAATLGDNVPGSVGHPLPNVDFKLTERGELLVRSPSVMLGYWKDEAETARVLDAAGWLSTGDLAEISDGRIRIAGRLKEMIVLTIGEKVNPNAVEAEICRDALFEQATVIGDGRPFLVALIVLNNAAWKQFAEENDATPGRPNAASVKTKVLAKVEKLLAGFPRYAQVRAVHLSLQPWTIEAGLLTPTLKIKRDILRSVFANEIERLYDHRGYS
jgi:long-chain acyl-CoA synthetase